MSASKIKSSNNFHESIVGIFKTCLLYLQYAGKKFKSLSHGGYLNLFLLLTLTIVWSFQNTHFWILHSYWPDIFSESLVRKIGLLPWTSQFIPLFISLIGLMIFILGNRSVHKVRSVNKGFKEAGLKNGVGTTPRVVDLTYLTPFRQHLLIDTEGVPFEEFEKKKNYIRSCVNSQIESIAETEQPKFLDLFLTQRSIPKKVSYSSLRGRALKPGEFVIGQGHGQVLVQNLFDLPHMLVAGTTGMGKSYFLRQMVLNLLENTPNLQVFAIDLKEGITMRPFKDLPNVKVIKDISEAATTLEKIKSEMKARFKLLERSESEVIDPKVHQKDPILVVIDECSLLYGGSRVSMVKKKETAKATEITDEIAKLSRAAHIHLVLGTQKVTKETISTHIQENIEGRICFKVTSIQGSALVVGTKIASTLPKISGRAISKFGVDMEEVQTPFLETKDLERRVKDLIETRKKNGSSNLQVMIDEIPDPENDSSGSISEVTTKEPS